MVILWAHTVATELTTLLLLLLLYDCGNGDMDKLHKTVFPPMVSSHSSLTLFLVNIHLSEWSVSVFFWWPRMYAGLVLHHLFLCHILCPSVNVFLFCSRLAVQMQRCDDWESPFVCVCLSVCLCEREKSPLVWMHTALVTAANVVFQVMMAALYCFCFVSLPCVSSLVLKPSDNYWGCVCFCHCQHRCALFF